MGAQKLSKQKETFVLVFDGDIVKSMRLAGYEGTDYQLEHRGNALLQDPQVVAAIKARSTYEVQTQAKVADRQKLQEEWTNIMYNKDPYYIPPTDINGVPIHVADKNIPLSIRLAATDKLAKSQGVFIENINHTGNVSISDIILGAYEVPAEQIEDAVITTKAELPPPSHFLAGDDAETDEVI